MGMKIPFNSFVTGEVDESLSARYDLAKPGTFRLLPPVSNRVLTSSSPMRRRRRFLWRW